MPLALWLMLLKNENSLSRRTFPQFAGYGKVVLPAVKKLRWLMKLFRLSKKSLQELGRLSNFQLNDGADGVRKRGV